MSLPAPATATPNATARRPGNILGDARAEADSENLSRAFVATQDYLALTQTHDFNFVVGRRGTGKTALAIKLAEHCRGIDNCDVVVSRPVEHEMLAFQSGIARYASDYRMVRAISRVVWRTHLMMEALGQLRLFWKHARLEGMQFLAPYATGKRQLIGIPGLARCTAILAAGARPSVQAQELPGLIATRFQVEDLQRSLQAALRDAGREVVILLDGLDEGWTPSPGSTAILGGLAGAVSDLRDSQTRVHGVAFIRDNIFRALATFDPDFSRNIEGSTLRLHWDESGLLNLVSARLRFQLRLNSTENDIRVWNRFAQRKLQDRDGFRYCLQHTLYRPRDLLVLLNQAYHLAGRAGRDHVIESDIESTAIQISHDRLTDLLKEYDAVLPGLGLFIDSLKGTPARQPYPDFVSLLDSAVSENPMDSARASDFALFSSGQEVFDALYSVGFVGLQRGSAGGIAFCHDGARADIPAPTADTKAAIHPCYWRALDTDATDISQDVLSDIYDDYESRPNPRLMDLRKRQLGQLVAELPSAPLGLDGARLFEMWALRAIKLLFAGSLRNPELHPAPSAVQRRDIVATIMATSGFWRRVRDDYEVRQIVFEVKNVADLGADDFRQAFSYTGNHYGKIIFIVTREQSEGVSATERSWIQELWHNQHRLICTLPAPLLVRCMKKLRNPKRRDYAEDVFNKRLDVWERKLITFDSGRG